MELKLLTTGQVAKRLGLSEWSVQRYHRLGEIPTVQFPCKELIFRDEDIDLLEQQVRGLTSQKVERLLQVSQASISRWATDGVLPSRKVFGARRFDWADVVAFGLAKGLLVDDEERLEELRAEYDPGYRGGVEE